MIAVGVESDCVTNLDAREWSVVWGALIVSIDHFDLQPANE